MDGLYCLTDEQLKRRAQVLRADAERSSRIATELLRRGVDHADVVRVRETATRQWRAHETVEAELRRRQA